MVPDCGVNVTSRRGGLSSGTTAKCAIGCMLRVTVVPDESLDTWQSLKIDLSNTRCCCSATSGLTSLSTTVAVEPAGLLSRSLSKLTGPVSSKITDSGGSFEDSLIVFSVAGPAVGGTPSDIGGADALGSVFHSCKVGSCAGSPVGAAGGAGAAAANCCVVSGGGASAAPLLEVIDWDGLMASTSAGISCDGSATGALLLAVIRFGDDRDGAAEATPVIARACASAAPAMLPVGFGRVGAGARIMLGPPGAWLGRSGCEGSGACSTAGTSDDVLAAPAPAAPSRIGRPSAP